ncbi:hypothetical protein GGS23DRAFT_230805 [Durotheca rogersii]|uniref:uncharacterized protein n=1 Tax=Durotheca rogersii TaxID=419775 RepID=UPI002220D8AC|nr:uncharacterized protein GGS23DRAFT_230805 [Durotheca rogersii]KAI5860595.1 hypothetical protein GGS23DRAFT_230805 [Durotheca rogersii]
MSSVAVPSSSRPFLPSPTDPAAYPYSRSHTQQRVDAPKFPRGLVVRETGLYTGGLRTPPAENMMSATYHNPVLSSTYESHVALARQPTTLAQAGRAGGMLCEAVANPAFSRAQQPQLHPQYQHAHSTQTLASLPQPQPHSQPNSSSSRPSTRPTTPASTGTLSVHSEGTISRKDSMMVTHSLQLPACINLNGGSLDDFAALMTCFFWFETMDTIQNAEHVRERPISDPIPPLSKYTDPCPAYKQWVNKVLSTTQVTQNVVLLALLFVYRLKKANPKVHGNPGSEYRLLTVALMLGNKFLDDNTYTNKTWAEVSYISVKEIHVMEVEFLSNMRYGLLTSKEEWGDWLTKLSCFYEYCERAKLEERRRHAAPSMPMRVPSPTHGRYTSPLPSPTSMLPSAYQGPPSSLAAAYSPNSAIHAQNWSTYHLAPSVSPLATKPSLGHPLVRKRSLEDRELAEPEAKRLPRQPLIARVSSRPAPSGPEPVRLPAPHLTLDTSQTVAAPAYPPTTYATQPAVSLPPLGHGTRAMSTVYSTTATSRMPQGAMLATCGPPPPSYVMAGSYGTPTKRHSPTSLAPFGSSPLAEAYGIHTPISNSPSVYLQQRASPYKPVRRVNTLLNPPPSIPLSEYHLGSNQMHYQPIGRRHDLRSGIVPEFMTEYANPRSQNHLY